MSPCNCLRRLCWSAMDSVLVDLQCTSCGAVLDAEQPRGVCPTCGKVLFARYDVATLREQMPLPAFDGRRTDLWRYMELLPVRDARFAISLGEGGTALLPIPRAAAAVGLDRGELLVKDEG